MLARLVALVFAAVVLIGAPARAEADETDQEQRALALIKEGRARYDLGKFDEAAKLFEQAYEVFPFPEALYNLGQVWRHKGDVKKAAFYYRSYLRNKPSAANRAAVEQIILELEAAANKPDGGAKPPDGAAKPPDGAGKPVLDPPKPSPPRVQAPTTIVEKPRPRATDPWYADGWAWTATGVGVVGLAIGGGFLYGASLKRDEAAKAPEFEKDDLNAIADERQKIGLIAGIGGVVVTAVGVALFVHNPQPARVKLGSLRGAELRSVAVEFSF